VASLDDINVERIIGAGSYGSVRLATHLSTGTPLALKEVPRAAARPEFLVRERQILESMPNDHPFLVRYRGCIEDPSRLLFVMDFVPGGELFTLLRRRGRLLERDARFYLCEVRTCISIYTGRNVIHIKV
jgi:serine/threonine protein kinase